MKRRSFLQSAFASTPIPERAIAKGLNATPAVVIVIKPGRAGGPSRSAHVGLRGHVSERAAAIIAEENAVRILRDILVGQAVGVVVADGDSHAVRAAGDTCFGSDISERAVAIVPVGKNASSTTIIRQHRIHHRGCHDRRGHIIGSGAKALRDAVYLAHAYVVLRRHLRNAAGHGAEEGAIGLQWFDTRGLGYRRGRADVSRTRYWAQSPHAATNFHRFAPGGNIGGLAEKIRKLQTFVGPVEPGLQMFQFPMAELGTD